MMANISWNEIQDRAVDRLYSSRPFATDAERVAMLFMLYRERAK